MKYRFLKNFVERDLEYYKTKLYSMAYAHLMYYLAYLKANYRDEFLDAIEL